MNMIGAPRDFGSQFLLMQLLAGPPPGFFEELSADEAVEDLFELISRRRPLSFTGFSPPVNSFPGGK